MGQAKAYQIAFQDPLLRCPMSTMTMQAGVEEAIKREVPEIKSVHAVNITSPEDPAAKLPFTN